MTTTYASWTSVTTLKDWLQVGNTNSGGWFWAGGLLLFVFIVTVNLIGIGFEAALMTALFLGIMVGTFLLYLGLIAPWILGVLVGGEILLIIYAIFSSGKSNYFN